jgi:hypothetical protein
MKSPRYRFNPWPISIISFFVIALIGCGTFIGFCSRHPADLVSADYYEQEVRYQGQINRSQQTGQLLSVAYNAEQNRLIIALPLYQTHSELTGTVQLYRPSAMNLDRQIKLKPNQEGVQMIDASTLLQGLWKVRVSWTVDKQDHFIEQKVIIGAKPS